MTTIHYCIQSIKDKRPTESREILVSLSVPVKDRRPGGFSRLDPELDRRVEEVPGVEFASDSLTYNFRVYVARLFDLEEVKAGVIEAVRQWYAAKHNHTDDAVQMVESEAAAA